MDKKLTVLEIEHPQSKETIVDKTTKMENATNSPAHHSDQVTGAQFTLADLSPEEFDYVVSAIPGGVNNIQDIYPLVPLQEGVLFHHLLNSKGDIYLIERQFAFDTRERVDNYIAALQWVVDRHDINRTVFLWQGLEHIVQVVCKRASLIVEELHLDPANGDIASQMLERFNMSNYKMELSVPPLIRIFVAQDEANDRWIYHQLSHHLIDDQVTINVTEEEIKAYLQGQTHMLPAPRPFRDYVTEISNGPSIAEHEQFFGKLLSDVIEPTSPYGLKDTLQNEVKIDEAHFFIESDLAKQIYQIGERINLVKAILVHLAFAKVLALCSGIEDVVFGTVLMGRIKGGATDSQMLGPGVNILPMRIKLGDNRVEDGIRQVFHMIARLIQHRHAPLVLAQKCSGVEQGIPLITSLLNYRRATRQSSVGIEGRQFIWESERTNYPLTINVSDYGDGFEMVAQVQLPIDPNRICNYMNTALKQLVQALETEPTALLGSLNVLPESERHQILFSWNDTARDFGAEARVHRLIEMQTAKTPNRVALEFENQELSYSELNRRANQLARLLRNKGVGPEVLVGVFVERSFEMVISMLAILKAGGAYVPLEPDYPGERLAHMFEDSRAQFVLTQAHIADRLPKVDTQVLILDRSWQEYACESGENLEDIGTP